MTDPEPGHETAAPPAAALRRTPLYRFHVDHGAHLVPFAGWEMPLYYTSILEEHAAVRNSVGLFDVSHMGILTVRGASAAMLLGRRTTANVARLIPGQCRYSFLLDANGTIVDDLLLTRIDGGAEGTPAYLVVPNAARADRIFDLLREHRRPDTVLARHSGAVAIVAVQGPGARSLLEREFDWRLADLKFYHARVFPRTPDARAPSEGTVGVDVPEGLGESILVSRTGYTGEPGYELFVRGADARQVADALLARGATACGLGARDTLRLEKGYLLSGQDFNRDRTPLEAGQDRFVDFDHVFVGREVLEQQRRDGTPSRLSGLTVEEPGAVPRHGTLVLSGADRVSTVTSGGLSPTLKHGIALAYLPPGLASPGTTLALDLRGRPVPARVVALPFVPAPAARG